MKITLTPADIILLDFADNGWHITFEGAVKWANTYPAAVVNSERVHALAPGEKFILKSH